jgi:hypothetical protein
VITFKSRFDKKYLSDGLKAHFKIKLRSIKYLPIAGIAYIVLLIIISFIDNKPISFDTFGAVMVITCIVFPFLYYYLNTLNFKNNSLYNKELNWEISDEYIKGSNEGLEFKVQWKNIREVYKLGNGIIIYPSINNYYWFPKSDFENENLFSEIMEFVKSNEVKNVVKN